MIKFIFSILSCVAIYGSVNAMEKYPLHEAARDGNLEAVRRLLDEGGNVNLQNRDGDTSLHCAICQDILYKPDCHLQTVKLLLEHQADINVHNNMKRTPLYNAACEGHQEILQLLLDRGADVNTQDQNGHTPLHGAARNGHIDVAQLLLNYGAHINIKDKNGYTPLFWSAVNCGQLPIFRTLLDRGADINIKNNIGHTPLFWGVFWGSYDYVKFLLEQGADINLKNNDGRTPRQLAIIQGFDKIAKLLNDWTSVQTAIDSIHRAESVTFCMALHDRVGNESPINILSQDLFQEIFSHVRPSAEDYRRIYDQQQAQQKRQSQSSCVIN